MKVSRSTKQNIIDYLLMRGNPFHGEMGIIQFLNRIWDLSSLPSTDNRYPNMERDLKQHIVYFEDLTLPELLYDRRLNLLGGPEEMFILFVENCVHPHVISNDVAQKELVSGINDFLRVDNLRLDVSIDFNGKTLYKIKSMNDKNEVNYDIVLSFAGEDRVYVEKVADFLTERGVNLFYDKYETATLWGKDLYEHLAKVYGGNARYCVMFISENYKKKLWTTHERRNAFAKAFMKNEEYILPARFDNTEIEGLRNTIGYIDLTEYDPNEFAELILVKLGKRE